MNNLFPVDIDWLNKVVLHPRIKLSTILLQHCSVVTILYQPCWQLVLRVEHNLVQACWYQPGTGCSFLRVYVSTIVLFVCREHETSAVQTLGFSPPAPAKKTRKNLNNLRGGANLLGGAKFLWHRSSGSGVHWSDTAKWRLPQKRYFQDSTESFKVHSLRIGMTTLFLLFDC
jgi:hypothetical protein